METVLGYLSALGRDAVFFLISFVLFYIGKKIKDWIEPGDLDQEIIVNNNTAVSSGLAGYYFGLTLILLVVLSSPGTNFISDCLQVLYYGILGILLLNVSYFINDKVIFRSLDFNELLYSGKNVSVGAVVFGSSVSSSVIIAASLNGDNAGLAFSIWKDLGLLEPVQKLLDGSFLGIVFFSIGQIALILFTFAYRKIVPYSLDVELKEKENLASGISYGGALVAIGIIIARALHKDPISMEHTLFQVFLDFMLGLIVIPAVRLVTDAVILPGSTLKEEISRDQNVGVGILEAVVLISFAGILFYAV
ncbi:PF03994 domain protein [Leptospira santarosai]|uniref:PF03994 domain protein n=1 Tax=Leptospira santarosai TaxID=28183 RepID=A0A2P1QXI8_9LEPT|nr:PF03994 domain protein [Leptospira santarosai]